MFSSIYATCHTCIQFKLFNISYLYVYSVILVSSIQHSLSESWQFTYNNLIVDFQEETHAAEMKYPANKAKLLLYHDSYCSNRYRNTIINNNIMPIVSQ